jgi:hypothetical protein
MAAKYPDNIFDKVKFSLSKEDVKNLAAIVEHLIFNLRETENHHAMEYKKLILNKWICLCKFYVKIPSSTASEKLIRHYNNHSEFKGELEEIMEFLMQTKETLEKTIAFAILNLSNQEETRTFKSFFSAFDEFITRIDEKEKSIKLCLIATFILKKLPVHIRENERDHRLLVLDFVKIILEGFDARLKSKLKEFLPKDIKSLNLTIKEQKQYQTFVEEFQI